MGTELSLVDKDDFRQLEFRRALDTSGATESVAAQGSKVFDSVEMPSVRQLVLDSNHNVQSAKPVDDSCGCNQTWLSKVTNFADEHPTVFWASAAVGAFGLATVAGTLAATSGGVLLPAVAATAKFGSVIATMRALKDVNDLSPILAWLRPR